MDKFGRRGWTNWSEARVPGRSTERPGLDDLSMSDPRLGPLTSQYLGLRRFLKSRRFSSWTRELQPGPWPLVIEVSNQTPATTRNACPEFV